MGRLFRESKDGCVSRIAFDLAFENIENRKAVCLPFEFGAPAETSDESELRKRRQVFQGEGRFRYEGLFRSIIWIERVLAIKHCYPLGTLKNKYG